VVPGEPGAKHDWAIEDEQGVSRVFLDTNVLVYRRFGDLLIENPFLDGGPWTTETEDA